MTDMTLPGLAIFGLLVVVAILSLLPKAVQRSLSRALFPAAGRFSKFPVLSALCGWIFVLLLVFAGLAILAHAAIGRGTALVWRPNSWTIHRVMAQSIANAAVQPTNVTRNQVPHSHCHFRAACRGLGSRVES